MDQQERTSPAETNIDGNAPSRDGAPGDKSAEDSASTLLNKSAAYSISMYVAKCTEAIGGLLVAKVLGPTLYGLRNAFGLGIRYEQMTDFGTYAAVNRLAPYHRGRGDTDSEAEVRDSVFAANIVYAGLSACVFVVASIILSVNGFEQVYVDLCLFFGVMVLTGRLLLFLHNELKIDKRMFTLGRVTMLKAALNAVACPLMAYMYGLRGFLIALAFVDIVAISYLVVYKKIVPSIRHFRISAFLKVLKVGFPMMLVLLLGLLLRTADRLVIIFVLSATALGYYGFAVMSVTIVTIIPAAIHSVTLAPIMELYGKSQDRKRVGKYLTGPTILMAYLLPLVVVVLYFAIEVPIAYLFSEFLESVVAIKILIFSAYLQSIGTPSVSILFALNKQVQLIGLVLPLVILSLGLNYAILKMGYGINGVALGVTFIYFVYLIVITSAATRQFDASLANYGRFLGTLIAPVIYAVSLVLALEYYFAGVDSLLLRSTLQIAVFMVAYVWIIVPVRNHFAIASVFRWLRGHLPRSAS